MILSIAYLLTVIGLLGYFWKGQTPSGQTVRVQSLDSKKD
jgi:hypothetical protein